VAAGNGSDPAASRGRGLLITARFPD
jgi:hypothetical protein